jgi:hypothetical protein
VCFAVDMHEVLRICGFSAVDLEEAVKMLRLYVRVLENGQKCYIGGSFNEKEIL